MTRGHVAVVGCGAWGRNLVRVFAGLGALRAVCDSDPAARTRAAELAPGVRLAADVAELLTDDEVRAVAVATPAATHDALTAALLRRGRDVLVEKPLALSYEAGAALERCARERGAVLMVGHVLEYHPAIQRLVGLSRSGELGDLRYVYSNRLSPGRIRREENILWSFAPHDVAVILRLLGEMPAQVSATGAAWVRPGIVDITVTHLRFASGARAHVHVSWLHPFKEQRLVVIGSRRMASFDDVARRLVLYDLPEGAAKENAIPVADGGESVAFDSTEPLRLECEAFLRAVATREPPLADAPSGLRVLRVLQLAEASLRSGGLPIACDAVSFGEST